MYLFLEATLWNDPYALQQNLYNDLQCRNSVRCHTDNVLITVLCTTIQTLWNNSHRVAQKTIWRDNESIIRQQTENKNIHNYICHKITELDHIV